MSVLSWNCRGLGNPEIVPDLHCMVKEKGPDLVFLMETKMQNKKCEFIRIKLGFDYMFGVDSVGRSGGLLLLWKNNFNVVIQNYSRMHINAEIKNAANNMIWKFTGFYGHPNSAKRKESWNLLRRLSTLQPNPWVCIGDFNEIVDYSEKKGIVIRPRWQMEDFQRGLEDARLHDLGFKGPKFTWNNGRPGREYTVERLDRAMANTEWRDNWRDAVVETLVCCSSDHLPLLLILQRPKIHGRKNWRPFRYEAGWSKRGDFNKIIQEAWEIKTPTRMPWVDFKRKLQKCKKVIQQWVQKSKPPTEKYIKEKTTELAKIQEEANPLKMHVEKEIREEIHTLLEQEEIKWKQRAKEDWLRDGDRNTKYFHACANHRQRKNRIDHIEDRLGRECEDATSVEKAFVEYFKFLFTSSNAHDTSECTDAIEGRLTESMKAGLTAIYTEDEIHRALMQMAPVKAPGPDDFSADFYQQQWSTVGLEVCKVVLHFLNGARMEENINMTHIALIPKKIAPRSVSDFRPISLCNVSYKIIAKVLANRLKLTLPHIISANQSAFIPGRLITDNIVAAYETLHSMESRMWGKVGYMGIKLDMSKAYDRVEWNFLEAVMRKMEFPEVWISLVMGCVKSVSYSVIVNGQPVGNIKPTRGIRQGDPLSPYLFLLCAEALSALLTRAERKGVLTGVPTSKKGPTLSHLFFADDSLIFCKANSVEWRRLTKILEKYEAASG
jgi:exonuclease III